MDWNYLEEDMIEKIVFNEGDVLCNEGAYEDYMYDIIGGTLLVYKDYQMPTQRLIAEISTGFVGEMGMIDKFPRTASVVASSTVRAVKIDAAGVDTYLKENPQKSLPLLKMLAQRLREVDKKYLSACQTISDYLDAADDKSGIISRMQEYADIYDRSQQ